MRQSEVIRGARFELVDVVDVEEAGAIRSG
jgi:hypothetical protein